MVKMACFSWKPRRHSEGDQKLLEDVMPNGVADLDQNGNAIPGGLAGIRQRMAAMGHTMNPQPVEEEPEDTEEDWSGNNVDNEPARRQRKMPAQGNENVNGNSDGGFTLSAEVCTEDGQAMKGNVNQSKRKPERTQSESAVDSGAGAQAIILAAANDDDNVQESQLSNAIILGPPTEHTSNNVIVLGAPEKTSEGTLVLGGPPVDQDQKTTKPADVIMLGPPPETKPADVIMLGHPPEKSDGRAGSGGPNESMPSVADTRRDSVVQSQVRKLNFGGSKKRQENFLLEQASIETAHQDTEAEKRTLGQSTSNMDAVVNYFPGREEVQKNLQVLSPGYHVNLDDTLDESCTDVPEECGQKDGGGAVQSAQEEEGGSAPETPAPKALAEAPSTPHMPGPDSTAAVRSEAVRALSPPRVASPKVSTPEKLERQMQEQAPKTPPRLPASAAGSPSRLDATALSSHSIGSLSPETLPPPQSQPRTPPPATPAAGDDDPDHLRVTPVPSPGDAPTPLQPPPRPVPQPQSQLLPALSASHSSVSSLSSSPRPPVPPRPDGRPEAARQATLLPARAALQPKEAAVTPKAEVARRSGVEAARGEGGVQGVVGHEGVLSPRAARSPAMGVDRGRDLILENIIAFRCENPEGAFHDWLVKLTPDDITEAIMCSSKGTGIWRELWDSVNLDLDGLQD